jgi:hypothetical protein
MSYVVHCPPSLLKSYCWVIVKIICRARLSYPTNAHLQMVRIGLCRIPINLRIIYIPLYHHHV